MDIATLAWKLLLGFALGAVIGLEREVNEKRIDLQQKKETAIIGLRSFSLITVLGVISGVLYPQFAGLSLMIAGASLLILLIFYVFDSLHSKDTGITSELGMICSFVLGVLLGTELFPVQLTLAFAVVLILLLSQKRYIKQAVEQIKTYEINAFISFALIAIVILPFLPNTTYALTDIPGVKDFFANAGITLGDLVSLQLINPFKLWLIVVLVTGVDFVGYILEKTLGQKRGWLIASAVGGFVSSTATTQSLAQESRTTHNIHPLLSAAILANIVSFLQIAIIIGAINAMLLVKLTPMIFLMILVGTGALWYFLQKPAKVSETAVTPEKIEEQKEEKIIDIGVALKFASLFLLISILSKIALSLFGKNGFLAATGIGALIGLDAVMINTAELAGAHINYQLAGLAFILANAVNLIAKSLYSFTIGKKEFAMKFLGSMLCIIVASFLGLLFI